jgi:hypothetical protein
MTIKDSALQGGLSTYNYPTILGKSAAMSFMLVIIVIYLAHVYFYDYICDDSFITLRYAQNLAEGHGLVFNLNERVEGFTSPLWTILLAGGGEVNWMRSITFLKASWCHGRSSYCTSIV